MIGLLASLSLLMASPALAWESHVLLMPAVLAGASPELRNVLMQPVRPTCPNEDEITYKKLASDLALNPKGKPPLLSPEGCREQRPVTGMDILRGAYAVVDEPDAGMDKDLPDSVDPEHFRKWMGGASGNHSQGFRHMYFAGMDWHDPLGTFQYPVNALGYAPDRAALFATTGRDLWKSGRQAWGLRVLGWAMHYVQDLAQPFHTAQIPNLMMVPWQALYAWPPRDAFPNLVHETTRTIGNYHWAYEKYVKLRLSENERSSPFADCLEKAESLTRLRNKRIYTDPREIALRVGRDSRRLAPAVGKEVLDLFGNSLKLSSIDIPHNQGVPNFQDYAMNPGASETRAALHETTCQALAEAVVGSRLLLEWALLGGTQSSAMPEDRP